MILTVKLVVFTITSGSLRVFSLGGNLPKVDVRSSTPLDKVALKIAKSLDISAEESYLEQLYTFSYQNIVHGAIEVVYFLLLNASIIPKRFEKDFFKVEEIGDSQNRQIIEYALQRLRWKIEYTNVVYSLLPQQFTLSQLQATYEAVLGRTLDKRNFRKKILSLGLSKY